MYRTSSHYGWKPDLPDIHDLVYGLPEALAKALPPRIDLRDKCPAVYDQGQLGSCTANAIAGAFQFDLLKQKLPVFVPSRLFIYYNGRSIENTIDKDSGAQIRDGMKSVSRLGVCSETDWPYVISEFSVKPFAKCYESALNHRSAVYHRVSRDLDHMRGCLAEGYPFVMGFTVYESFEGVEVAASGVLDMPAKSETMIGGHAVLVVGYDDQQRRFIIRNSWGPAWGMQGYFTMPYEYLLTPDLADDFWTIRSTITAAPQVTGTAHEEALQMAGDAKKKNTGKSARAKASRTAGVAPVKTRFAVITQACASPGCGSTVTFDPNTPPLPALVKSDTVLTKAQAGSSVTVFLTCGNPAGAHTLPYTMILKQALNG